VINLIFRTLRVLCFGLGRPEPSSFAVDDHIHSRTARSQDAGLPPSPAPSPLLLPSRGRSSPALSLFAFPRNSRKGRMGDDAAANEQCLAPLVSLVERLRAELEGPQGRSEPLKRLRAELKELQGRSEAPGEELEARRRRLRLAESRLVERLLAELERLHGGSEEPGEELEAKRRRLRLAEATLELVQRRQEEVDAAEASVMHPQGRENDCGLTSCDGTGSRRPAPTCASTGRPRRGGPAPEPHHGAAAGRLARAPQPVAVREGSPAEVGLQDTRKAGEGVACASPPLVLDSGEP
jgi:hypothetical protein